MPFVDPEINRRGFMKTLSAGTFVANLLTSSGQKLSLSAPRLNHAWIDVHNDGTATFVAGFNDNIQFWLGFPGVSKQHLKKQASVDLKDTDLAPDLKDNRTITGAIDNFATVDDGIYTNGYYYASQSDFVLPSFLTNGVLQNTYLDRWYTVDIVHEIEKVTPHRSESNFSIHFLVP